MGPGTTSPYSTSTCRQLSKTPLPFFLFGLAASFLFGVFVDTGMVGVRENCKHRYCFSFQALGDVLLCSIEVAGHVFF